MKKKIKEITWKDDKPDKDKFKERQEQFLKIAEELSVLFYKKNKDYDDAYFKNFNNVGFDIDKQINEIDFYLQLRRKFARLAGFAERRLNNKDFTNEVANETEEDTINDICIYCIMEIIKRRLNDKSGNI